MQTGCDVPHAGELQGESGVITVRVYTIRNGEGRGRVFLRASIDRRLGNGFVWGGGKPPLGELRPQGELDASENQQWEQIKATCCGRLA